MQIGYTVRYRPMSNLIPRADTSRFNIEVEKACVYFYVPHVVLLVPSYHPVGGVIWRW